eukprot:6191996-Pleurochrysis_carterae.AAC.1
MRPCLVIRLEICGLSSPSVIRLVTMQVDAFLLYLSGEEKLLLRYVPAAISVDDHDLRRTTVSAAPRRAKRRFDETP